MRFTNRIGFMFAFAFFSACAGAWAGDWVPARDHGAYVENIQYGLEPSDDWGNLALRLRVTLHEAGEFSLANTYYGYATPEYMNPIYQSLVQAKADSLPVMLLVEAEDRTFTRVLIGTVDPQFPVALRAPLAPGRDAAGAAPTGFDLLGRARSQASARAPLLARPASR